MKTYDYEQVNAVLAPLKAKFADCAHAEGNECEALDKHLDCCASICFEVARALTSWARKVFSGDVAFDPEAENLWRAEVAQIYSRAIRIWQLGRKAELPCWELPGQEKLAAALWELNWILDQWISPKQSVGPSARVKLKLSDEERAAIKEQLGSLSAFAPQSRID